MKTLFALILAAIACSCARREPVLPLLHLRDYDPKNNRVDEKGNLVPWTNWGVGFFQNGRWIKVLEAQEK